MNDSEYSFILGIIFFFDSKEELASILSSESLNVDVGLWSITLRDFPGSHSRFKIAYEGNLNPQEPFVIEASAYGVSTQKIARWCSDFSDVLVKLGIKHEMTHFGSNEEELKTYTLT